MAEGLRKPTEGNKQYVIFPTILLNTSLFGKHSGWDTQVDSTGHMISTAVPYTAPKHIWQLPFNYFYPKTSENYYLFAIQGY